MNTHKNSRAIRNDLSFLILTILLEDDAEFRHWNVGQSVRQLDDVPEGIIRGQSDKYLAYKRKTKMSGKWRLIS